MVRAKIEGIAQRDPRFHAEAYFFVLSALGRVLSRQGEARHISGKELVEGVRDLAREQFGPMAKTVFEHWGVKNSLDFGAIVFNMVAEGVLLKSDKDSPDDFRDERLFTDLFDELSGYRLTEDAGAQPMHV